MRAVGLFEASRCRASSSMGCLSSKPLEKEPEVPEELKSGHLCFAGEQFCWLQRTTLFLKKEPNHSGLSEGVGQWKVVVQNSSKETLFFFIMEPRSEPMGAKHMSLRDKSGYTILKVAIPYRGQPLLISLGGRPQRGGTIMVRLWEWGNNKEIKAYMPGPNQKGSYGVPDIGMTADGAMRAERDKEKRLIGEFNYGMSDVGRSIYGDKADADLTVHKGEDVALALAIVAAADQLQNFGLMYLKKNKLMKGILGAVRDEVVETALNALVEETMG
ncbi:unnamed protein product [Ostreobium quekettii]|uniref:Uncharacterized protein n=1 Tax=Ostreobium quekettii TaxID=121088 RepID=A0A8S1JA19_9CHLO|nr:unnamed protein product [Ostreobium quekettii]